MLEGRLHPLLRGEAAVEDVVAALRKPWDIVLGAEHHLVAFHRVGLAVEDAPAEAGPVGGSDQLPSALQGQQKHKVCVSFALSEREG